MLYTTATVFCTKTPLSSLGLFMFAMPTLFLQVNQETGTHVEGFGS